MTTAEFELQVLNTEAFITADPQLLDVYRPGTPVSDGAGGRIKGEPERVASGTFRCIRQAAQVSQGDATTTTNGTLPPKRLVIVGHPDIDLHRGDYFNWRGWRWEVTHVHEQPDYETKADCVRKGEVA
jgi:hypothetical protein